MSDTNNVSWESASVVVVAGALDHSSASSAYTLALALDSIVGHVVVVAFNGEDSCELLTSELPVVTLSSVPEVIDWPVDAVFNCASAHTDSVTLCERLKKQQNSVWIERHDENAAAGSDEQWLLTNKKDNAVATIVPQPRLSRWREETSVNQYFVQQLQTRLSGVALNRQPSFETNAGGSIGDEKRDVVMFWKQNDSGLYGRRSDMVAKYLASRSDIRQVLVVDAPIELQQLKKKRGDDNFDQNRFVYTGTVSTAFRQNDNGAILRRVFCYRKTPESVEEYLSFLQQRFNELGIDASKSLFWMYPKLQWGERIIEHFKPFKRVMDVVDDHRSWPGVSDKKKAELSKHYEALLGDADKVITNCLPVKLSMYQFHKDIALVPNGCELKPEVVEPTHLKSYEQLKAHKGPVLGFVGNLEAKIDNELLRKLANALPDALIVLVGSTHANPDIRTLGELPNVLMTGVVPHKFVGAFVKRFDVGLVPHKKMALTENMNPLKVFVYLSHHIPVVATDVPNIAKFDYVWQTNDHDAFVEKVKQLTVNKGSLELNSNTFNEFIKRNSWDMRLAVVVDNILSSTKDV
ncbi:glycosyltransferase [Idiomarina sp.]|uniref:glycosyltransferase n=1 Tax=Idiomarina sp. TaxID=1874361 RepID=UPI0026175670|nr:glycosyltransferase [Idiomarina sp.]